MVEVNVKVVWTDQAIKQVNQIAEYIALESSNQAHRIVKLIFDTTKRLEKFPEVGAVVPELEDQTIREVLVYSYRIIYQWFKKDREVRVLGVIHAARLLNWDLFR
ncbi:MAG: type II toxin-antitoxin system RelE/ParE family toxin [Planctomycetaceae bacterium]|jgi:plasmid stabilization system protein ParE|nr:type II toxin-antitoxin system RelE/ParE family toxin [Planctomycetaceae bacterium]